MFSVRVLFIQLQQTPNYSWCRVFCLWIGKWVDFHGSFVHHCTILWKGSIKVSSATKIHDNSFAETRIGNRYQSVWSQPLSYCDGPCKCTFERTFWSDWKFHDFVINSINFIVRFPSIILQCHHLDAFRLACMLLRKPPKSQPELALEESQSSVKSARDFIRKYHLNDKLFLTVVLTKFLTDFGYELLYHFGPSFFVHRGLDEHSAGQVMRYF